MQSEPTEILNMIKNLPEIKPADYSKLKSLLYKKLFNKIPVILNKIPAGDTLYRTVPVYRTDMTMGRKKYLSYRPLEYSYPYFNRCSEPEQRHFYCSTNRHLSIGECSYFLSETESHKEVFEKDHERLEVGGWGVKKDLYVADLRYGDFSHIDNKSHQSTLKVRYKEYAKDQFVVDFFEYINHFFEAPITKAEHLRYWLSACYSNYLFDDLFKPVPLWGTLEELESVSSIPIDGIFYHSVKGIQTSPPMEGYNLALRTEVIDNNKLQLKKAGIFETRQIGAKEFILDDLKKLNADIEGDSWYYKDFSESQKSN
jgi:hypothetical protein